MSPKRLLILLALTSIGWTQNPVVVPAPTVNGVDIGPGYFEAYQHQIARTAKGVVYIALPDDNSCQSSGLGVIHMYKGQGSQAGHPEIPSSFAEVDSANRPRGSSSGTCMFAGGSTATPFSPDMRLVGTTIYLAYGQTTSSNVGSIIYKPFDTVTDTWGSSTTVVSGIGMIADGGWARAGQNALTVDASGNLILIYTTGSTLSYRKCSTSCGTAGNWTGGTIFSGTSVSHPSIITGGDDVTRAVFINNSLSTSAAIMYTEFNGSTWITAETVATNTLQDTNDDQSPSLAVDSSNHPHILYLIGTAGSFTNNYTRIKVRTGVNTYVDNSPQLAAGPASASGTLSCHTPQNYFDWAGNQILILAHDPIRNPGPYKYQTGGYGNNWSALLKSDPRDENNTTAGTPGIDGSANIRYDPLRDTNKEIVDYGYYDEDTGAGGGGTHFSEAFYKAMVIAPPPTGIVIAPSLLKTTVR